MWQGVNIYVICYFSEPVFNLQVGKIENRCSFPMITPFIRWNIQNKLQHAVWCTVIVTQMSNHEITERLLHYWIMSVLLSEKRRKREKCKSPRNGCRCPETVTLKCVCQCVCVHIGASCSKMHSCECRQSVCCRQADWHVWVFLLVYVWASVVVFGWCVWVSVRACAIMSTLSECLSVCVC